MRKLSILMIVVAVCFSLAGCSSPKSVTPPSPTQSVSNEIEPEQSTSGAEKTEKKETSSDIKQLKSGDAVSIIGQKANSTLVDDNTIWVQVQQPDKTFIMYHCQLKGEFIDKANDIKLSAATKVKGLFLSVMDLEQENASPLVTLHDCEIIN